MHENLHGHTHMHTHTDNTHTHTESGGHEHTDYYLTLSKVRPEIKKRHIHSNSLKNDLYCQQGLLHSKEAV